MKVSAIQATADRIQDPRVVARAEAQTPGPADHWIKGESSFNGHLKAAASINWRRAKVYAEATHNRSLPLSLALVSIETLTRPIAQQFDRRAKPYQQQGIAIVKGDFVSMGSLPSASTPPTYRGRATKQDKAHLRQWLGDYQRELKGLLKPPDFPAIADRSAALLAKITQLEKDSQSHFAMCKHLVESIGYAASHAPGYSQASGGTSAELSADLIRWQLTGLGLAPWIDGQAQRFHQEGIGIVVNDVPAIPLRPRIN